MKCDWIVIHQQGLRCECRRCGATAAMELPAPITTWLGMAKAFQKEHQGCRPRSATAAP